MQPDILAAAPRCGARTRGGTPCRAPAVAGNARCRMHGGKGSGAPRGNVNAWKYGLRSTWIRQVSRYLRATRDGALPQPPLLPTVPRAEPSRLPPAARLKTKKKPTYNPMHPEFLRMARK